MINSCIYNGTVIHKRFKPKEHFFKYKVFSLLIDLSEIQKLCEQIKFFSLNKFNLISFYERDHGARDGTSLEKWVKNNLENTDIDIEGIKIKLLCYPRILGYVFNPLSIFFIYNKNDKLVSILYEVKNTFGEQHTYIFKVENQNNLIQNNCSKKFHVSPFIDMDCNYFFRILNPTKKLSVVIDQYDKEGKILFASQEGKRSDLTGKNLMNSYLKHPFMTFKIISAIHFEAFKLWIKGIKFVKKKLKIRNNVTTEN
ncbi:DUF1365 domain-containing protein [Candidatus Pelagibacter communis]|uniref:DUF1365 domain-containing protein n=1 Tax=Pelagibacter ubique TaxID=198252 RepID=UPI00094D0681|nr:DUF1365 domain-containing protein [Candidatus Pelagibacter ubique]|tara:strand:+ start:593 stop:1357 length:765 start_codon:yes stop_codon:yes gene_type:complete